MIVDRLQSVRYIKSLAISWLETLLIYTLSANITNIYLLTMTQYDRIWSREDRNWKFAHSQYFG